MTIYASLNIFFLISSIHFHRKISSTRLIVFHCFCSVYDSLKHSCVERIPFSTASVSIIKKIFLFKIMYLILIIIDFSKIELHITTIIDNYIVKTVDNCFYVCCTLIYYIKCIVWIIKKIAVFYIILVLFLTVIYTLRSWKTSGSNSHNVHTTSSTIRLNACLCIMHCFQHFTEEMTRRDEHIVIWLSFHKARTKS